MHHYRCQNVYISATASERIVDTLEFFPHNYQMPRLSSTNRLIMAANDMTDALQNPHPDVPFTQVGDDTISALTALAEIFKLKLQKEKKRPSSRASQGRSTPMPLRVVPSNVTFSHASSAPNDITDNLEVGDFNRLALRISITRL
jgi:hypothetical protein